VRVALRARSLRFRLLAATCVGMLLALVLAGLMLASLFREQVLQQFAATLTAQLDQVTARLEFDATGKPQLDEKMLSDPRWSRPYSGLYWQVDGVTAGKLVPGVLRSRSLWDAVLAVENDTLADGTVHVHEIAGPNGTKLLLVERTVRHEGAGDAEGTEGTVDTPWRLLVAADLQPTAAAVARFNGVLAASLLLLLALLCAAALAQVTVGLAPLRALKQALAAVHAGTAPRLEGRFPSEVQPLIDDFNAVLARNAEVVSRARAQAGNLAHAIKTPLAAMAQAAATDEGRAPSGSALAPLVREQVALALRQVDWHLARSRAAAAVGLPGVRADVAPLLAGLLRVLGRVHHERGLAITAESVAADCSFAGEAQDLQEILGNVLDNACKWARHEVRVAAAMHGGPQQPRLRIVVDDDGPGIDADRRQAVIARGMRLDESVPGSGLGLAIAHELVDLYHGELTLGSAPLGGLRVEIELPGALL
jgi:signal transduction histidine kinase